MPMKKVSIMFPDATCKSVHSSVRVPNEIKWPSIHGRLAICYSSLFDIAEREDI
jgi:hypothetical protein